MRAKGETGESNTFCLLVICQEEILKANALRDGELGSLRSIRRLVSSYTSSSGLASSLGWVSLALENRRLLPQSNLFYKIRTSVPFAFRRIPALLDQISISAIAK